MKKIISFALLTVILVAAVTGCVQSGGKKGEIVFANAQWDSIMLHNAIAGVIAESVFDYSWREIPGSTTVLHEGLIKGEVDVHMEVWTDNIASYRKDLAENKFKQLGVNFDDNYQGIYVPRYVIEGDSERGIEPVAPDLKYVWDLKKYPEVFADDSDSAKGRVYGAIPGWEVDEILHKKYLHYNLDENFIYFRPGSDPALSAAISSAYEKGEPIAAYYWEPTWLLGMYDMVLLEDKPYDEATYLDGETELPPVKVTVCISNDFAEDEANKELIEFLSKYETSSALTSEGLAYMQESGANYTQTAKWFLSTHEDLLNDWLNNEQVQTLKSHLSD